MSWTYRQHDGALLNPAGVRVATGYSGAGHGKNDPQDEDVRNVGPIPVGAWLICGPPRDTPTHGPYVLRLEPDIDTNTHGRSRFLIHGDSIRAPGTASKGCIILSRPVREAIWASGDLDLLVIP